MIIGIQEFLHQDLANRFHNVHLLNRNVVSLGGFTFAGCVAWYQLDPVCVMNDLKQIHNAVEFSEREHHLDLAFLRSLNRGEIDVLITHVPLIEEGMNPVLASQQPYMNKYYHHSLDGIVQHISPSIAISGHTHHGMNQIKEGTRFVSAPVGYPHEIKYEYRPHIVPYS